MQKTNRDLLNPLLLSLTYDLKDVGRPTAVNDLSSASEQRQQQLVDMNQYPVIDQQHSATNITVRRPTIAPSCLTPLQLISSHLSQLNWTADLVNPLMHKVAKMVT